MCFDDQHGYDRWNSLSLHFAVPRAQGCANQVAGLYANIILSMIVMPPLCRVGRIFSGRFERTSSLVYALMNLRLP